MASKSIKKKGAILPMKSLGVHPISLSISTDITALVSARAYQLYADRGCEQGHDLEDWLLAEKEVMRQQINKMAM